MGGADCLSCTMFAQFDALAMSYARDAFDAIAPGVRYAFQSFVGLWFVYTIVVHAVIRGDLDLKGCLSQVLIFSLCATALSGVDIYWEWIYQPAYEAMNGFAVALVTKGSTGLAVNDVPGMLRAVEGQIMRVLLLTKSLMDDGGITNLGAIIGAIVLAIPYLFVWGLFLAFVVEGIFKLLAVTAISPILIACFGFKATRGFTLSGGRLILSGVLTVMFAAVAMGFTLHVMDMQFVDAPVTDTGFRPGIAEWVYSTKYWSVFVLGFVSVLLHMKAATLAANLSGANDGAGPAAAVVGAGLTALATIKSAGLYTAAKGGQISGKMAGASHDRLWKNAKANVRNQAPSGSGAS